jgi:hypothetical protein
MFLPLPSMPVSEPSHSLLSESSATIIAIVVSLIILFAVILALRKRMKTQRLHQHLIITGFLRQGENYFFKVFMAWVFKVGMLDDLRVLVAWSQTKNLMHRLSKLICILLKLGSL